MFCLRSFSFNWHVLCFIFQVSLQFLSFKHKTKVNVMVVEIDYVVSGWNMTILLYQWSKQYQIWLLFGGTEDNTDHCSSCDSASLLLWDVILVGNKSGKDISQCGVFLWLLGWGSVGFILHDRVSLCINSESHLCFPRCAENHMWWWVSLRILWVIIWNRLFPVWYIPRVYQTPSDIIPLPFLSTASLVPKK